MAGCLMNVVVQKGTLNAYRSYLYGSDLSLASAVEQVTHNVAPSDTSVFVTGIVHRDLARTQWPAKLQVADIKPHYRRLADLALVGPSMTSRISTPRRCISIGMKRVMVKWAESLRSRLLTHLDWLSPFHLRERRHSQQHSSLRDLSLFLGRIIAT
jgi:hypothetical protein